MDDERCVLTERGNFLLDKGCLVHFAATAEKAIELAGMHYYDCILLDVMLGETNGFSLCTRIQELNEAPIIFLSSLAGDESQLEGFLSGGADYITKNTSLSLFWAKIETRIRLSLSGKHILAYPPLSIDLTSRRVFMKEQKIVMTSLEFDVLALIAAKPRVIFSVDDIYRQVWDADPRYQGQTVQAHLSRLRRKLDKAFPSHYFIETVWGKGYQFIPVDGCF